MHGSLVYWRLLRSLWFSAVKDFWITNAVGVLNAFEYSQAITLSKEKVITRQSPADCGIDCETSITF